MLLNIFFFSVLFLFVSANSFAQCGGDLDWDRDVDGNDLAAFIADFGRIDCTTGSPCLGDVYPIGFPDGVVDEMDLAVLAMDFGRTDCPLSVPPNLFHIGDSIGEGTAAYNDIGVIHHEAVWATGFDRSDFVHSFNERLEDLDPIRYYENNSIRDDVFNRAIEGSEMADFKSQAIAMVAQAAKTPGGRLGMVAVLLGNNDVCTEAVGTMTDLDLFEEQYRAGLDFLAESAVTKNAYIHISGIPDIYWLWIAKRDSFWCRYLAWPNVPCRELLDNPANDCGSGDSDLDPDTIHPDDGPNCIRRKKFHAAIRDDYNRILRDVLKEYKDDGLLPNAYYIDIFHIRFDSIHINGGDCFHPSITGQALLAEEQWCHSPWGVDDPFCLP